MDSVAMNTVKQGPLGLLPLCVVWDDTCAFCARSIRIIARLDVCGLVHPVGASQIATMPDVWTQGWSAEDGQRGLWCKPIGINTTTPLKSTPCLGFKAVRRLGWVLPLTWPVFWLGYVPILSWIGELIYAWIAKNRRRWGCESPVCSTDFK
jgi:predicted DCC family thiol-disulfide oxidoreductase YuxK